MAVQKRSWQSAGIDCLFLTQRDFETYIGLLVERFPDVRFVDRNYDQSDYARSRAPQPPPVPASNIDIRKPRAAGQPEIVFYRRPPVYLAVMEAWNISPRWRPRWRPPDSGGRRFLANHPDYHLQITVLIDIASSEQAPPETGRLHIMRSSPIFGFWDRGDDEGKKFVAVALSILESICTRRFVNLDPTTLSPIDRTAVPIARHRAGRDATRWAAKRPENIIEGFLKPVWVEKSPRLTRNAPAARSRHSRAAARPGPTGARRGGS